MSSLLSNNAAVLVRCVSCGRNFETRQFGRVGCPICHRELYIDPPEGYAILPEPEPPALEPRDLSPRQSVFTGPPEDHSDPYQDSGPSPDSLEELLVQREQLDQNTLAFIPPWETKHGNILERFFQTMRMVLFAPGLFFSHLASGRIRRPLVFGWIVCTIAVFFFSMYLLWFLEQNPAKIQAELFKVLPDADVQSLLYTALAGSPLFGLMSVVFWSLLYHLGVVLTTQQNQGFKATFRATAYALAPLSLAFIPIIGFLLGSTWSLGLRIFALAHVHHMNPGRAVLAVMLPSICMYLLMHFLPQSVSFLLKLTLI